MSNGKYKKAGLPPGTLVFAGDRKAVKANVSVMEYGGDDLAEYSGWEKHKTVSDKSTITWINVDGLHEVELLEQIGTAYGLHPLVMEDILHTAQRPKIEDYGDYLYITCKMIYYQQDGLSPVFEQESIVLGKNYVLSFGEKEGDVFEPIRERLRSSAGKMRRMGADYLAYALVDAIVDGYFIVLERFGEDIEDLDDRLVEKPGSDILAEIRKLKREMLYLHKSIWPMREVLGSMERGETPLIGKNIRFYIRDVYDHTIQAMDTTETYRDILSGMMDIYLSSISNRMNEIMKVLTVISTVFIPLTFIVGVYGMNFRFMPELGWKWGYFCVMGLMLLIGCAMIVYFKRKKWF